MADPYQECPCGCGRKVKQCASRKVLQELDSIREAIDGNQRIAAVEKIRRLIESEGETSLLLTLLVRIQLELGELEAAAEAVEKFAAVAPESSTLKIQQATIKAHEEGQSDAALTLLMQGLEGPPPDMESVALSIATVAQGLLLDGNPAAASRLLRAVDANQGLLRELLMEAVVREGQQHIILRLARVPQPVADDHPLAMPLAEVDQAMDELSWLRAEQRLDELRKEHPDSEPVLRRFGALLMLRGRNDEAAGVFKQIAGLESIDDHERLLAEAVAVAIAGIGDEWYVDMLQVTYPVESLEAVLGKLNGNRQVQPVPPPPSSDDDEPPPRGIYQILDKPLPEDNLDQLTLDEVPQLIGVLLAYGKQTDAPARLRVEAHANNLPGCEEVVRQSVPDLKESEREKVGELPLSTTKLALQLVMPDTLSQEKRHELRREAQRRTLMEIWPRTPHPALDGLTPAVAARDKTRKRTVAALVLMQETGKGSAEEFGVEDCRELRKSLGLPHEVLPASEIASDGPIPLDCLTRMTIQELDDDQLVNALVRVSMVNVRVLAPVLDAALQRPALVQNKELQLDRLCYEVAQQAASAPAALSWLQRAADTADAIGSSAAEYLLGMLMPAVLSNQSELVQDTLQRLTTKHINEPGVRETIVRFFHSIGIDPATGAPVGQPAAAAAGPAAPAQEEGKLWTPGGDGGGQQDGGKLWLPD